MKISVRWLNEYLEPATITAESAEETLTFVGFPIETAEELPNGDVRLDVEVTSNRGDCLSHFGLAREIAAATGRRLRHPNPAEATPTGGAEAATSAAVDNRATDVCRMFTAQVIRGVKVGPSPKWLVDALEAVGQRSINNVVDVTNYVAFEYGQPTHVFDLKTIGTDNARAKLIVRHANKGEKLALLDGRTITLVGDELVVADTANGGRAVSLAGVMGGKETEVTGATTDVLLEAATWDPVTVRRAARRFNIRTDASYRFERIVDPRTIEKAAARAAGLIVKLGGGTLAPGMIRAGVVASELTSVKLRPSRVKAILGQEVAPGEIARVLGALEIMCSPNGEDAMLCTVPAHRPDVDREIDLIEEIARIRGLDKLPIHDKVGVRVKPPQNSERAVRELGSVLNGLGFYETITFTFVSEKDAAAFIPSGMESLRVCDERRKADPVLRPSALPSLLACRRRNQDGGVEGDGDGGVRLFELSAVFAQQGGKEVERRNLALAADACFPAGSKSAEQKQNAVRLLRGAIESAARALGGAQTKIEFEPAAQTPMAAYEPGTCAGVVINGKRAGIIGLLSAAVQKQHDLSRPMAIAEVGLDELVALFPPKSLVHALPEFPAIERDLSLVVAEQTAWASIERLVSGLKLPLLEASSFVGTFRGQQVGTGKKSVTLRLRFRDDKRTLRHEEVDPQVATVVENAKAELGAEMRG
jgi:phenylalanyl-tRNA synthetase beta chain